MQLSCNKKRPAVENFFPQPVGCSIFGKGHYFMYWYTMATASARVMERPAA